MKIKNLTLYEFDEHNSHTGAETVTLSVGNDFHVPGRNFSLELKRGDGVHTVCFNTAEMYDLMSAIDHALSETFRAK